MRSNVSSRIKFAVKKRGNLFTAHAIFLPCYANKQTPLVTDTLYRSYACTEHITDGMYLYVTDDGNLRMLLCYSAVTQKLSSLSNTAITITYNYSCNIKI